MKRLINILVFFCLCLVGFAQEETRVVDSLLGILPSQEGREKVLTMIELTWEFFDISFNDGIIWGEKAIQLSHEAGDVGLEAEASYAIGVQYGYHNDLDLAQDYLKKAYGLFELDGNEAKAFDALWNQAYFELLLGNMDSASKVFQKVLSMAEQHHDDLACAQVHTNLAAVYYHLNDFNGSIEALKASRGYYELLNDSAALVHADLNLATCYGECGRSAEARELFASVIPRLVALKEYNNLLIAYKNYGLLFERDLINYDSATYYFEKALAITEMEDLSRQDRQTISNTKADVLTELGNVAFVQKQFLEAMKYYEEALSLAEGNGYHFGKMQAALGLGQLYAKMGQATQSLQYMDRYAEEALRSGITLMEPVVKKFLILDYARLGRFGEMEKELENLDEQRAALVRENADIYEHNRTLKNEISELLLQYESQSDQIQTLQAQRNHYRLAFFGLLAIILVAMAFWIFRRILLNNRHRSK
jgi:tetratricopeptide (TPR) repeat protein